MPHARRFIRTMCFAAAAAALITGSHAVGRPAEGAADTGSEVRVAEASPFLGLWELDLSRMPANYGPPPKRVTYSFDEAGSGEWRTKVEITAPDDSVRNIAIQYRRDGQAVQGEGDTADGERAAFQSPAPNVLVMGLAKDNALEGVRVYAVSEDGQEMTESAAGADPSGMPFVRNFHFRRIR